MDKRITFRFFDVVAKGRHRTKFEDALRQIRQITPVSDREEQLAQDYYVRAEIIEEKNGAIFGEITRIQKTNYPSEVQQRGRVPLNVQNPLGHGIVFRFLPGTQQLGLQYDPRVLSPSKFSQYISLLIEGSFFEFIPIVRDDMWERFNDGAIKKVSISVKRPNHLEQVGTGAPSSVARSMRDMAEAYSAPSISIEISMGRKRGGLGEAIRSAVERFRSQAIDDAAEVTTLKAKIKRKDEPAEDLDLLEDILSTKEVLELHSNDPEANYKIKLDALHGKMREWL